MITDKNDAAALKKQWPPVALCVAGAVINLAAVVTDGSNTGALVAIGCSLIAIGAAGAGKGQGKGPGKGVKKTG